MGLRARSLGAELFGTLSMIQAYIGTVTVLCGPESWQALIKYGTNALALQKRDEFLGYIRISFLLDFIGAFVTMGLSIAGAYIVSRWFDWNQEIIFLAILSGASAIFNLTGTPTGILRILNRFSLFTVQQTVTAVLGLTLTVTAWWLDLGLMGFMLAILVATASGNIILFIMSLVVLKRENFGPFWMAPMRNKREFLRFSWWSHLSLIQSIPLTHLDIIIASKFISLEAAGVYKFTKQVTQIMTHLTSAVYRAVYPQFTGLVADRKNKEALRYAMKIGVIIFLIIAPPSILLASTSYWWLRLFGESFHFGWLALSIFLLLKMFTLPRIVINPMFIAMGYVRANAAILLVANVVYLGLAWPMATRFGLIGLILAWFIHSNVIFSVKSMYLRRRMKDAPKIAA